MCMARVGKSTARGNGTRNVDNTLLPYFYHLVDNIASEIKNIMGKPVVRPVHPPSRDPSCIPPVHPPSRDPSSCPSPVPRPLVPAPVDETRQSHDEY